MRAVLILAVLGVAAAKQPAPEKGGGGFGAPGPRFGAPGPRAGAPGPRAGAPGPRYGAHGPRYGAHGPRAGAPGPRAGAHGPRSALACGSHTLTLGSYTISSPGHPSNYGNNYDCTYSLTPGAGVGGFSVECSAFDIENHPSCDYDWLKVAGVKYCGTDGPSTNVLGATDIEFHTDFSEARTGFLCTITAEPEDLLDCGTHALTAGVYVIKSPNHPADYDDNVDCAYNITPGVGVSTISLACCAFDLESQASCSYDWLRVDGVKYCGSQGPPALTVSGALNIDFHSDYSVVKPGFRCQVSASG